MTELNHFRTYEVAQDEAGQPLELLREGARVVCLGFDTNRRRFVEISALGEGDGEQFLERAAAVAGQSHPALAPVVDYGSEDGVFFYASDLVDGEPLASYTGRVKAVPPEAVMHWVLRLAEGATALAACDLVAGIDSARFYRDDHGRISVRIVDYGIDETAGDAGGGAGGGAELAEVLRGFTNYQSPGEAPVYPPEIEILCEELARVGSAEEAAELLRHCGAPETAPRLPVAMQPRLLLERELFRRSRPEHVLPARYRPVRRAGEISPYESVVQDSEGGHLSRILVLPPERLVSERMLEVFENETCPSQVRVGAFWKHEDFRLIAKGLAPGFHLAGWIAARDTRDTREIVCVLDRVGEALDESARAGAKARILRAEDVLIEFERMDERQVAALCEEVPAWRWPPFGIKIRTHPSMRALTEIGDEEIPDGAEDVLAAAERGDRLPVGVVIAWYFNLRNRGLNYQANELVESLREVADATGSNSAAEGVQSPLVSGDQENEGYHEDAEGQVPLGQAEPLGAHDPLSEEYDDGDVEDDDEEHPDVAISPIAAAMGFNEPEDEEDGEYSNPIARQVSSSGFGKALPTEAEEPVEQDLDSLLGGDYDAPSSHRTGYLLILFILIAAIAIAAAVAHLTGRAFWLR